MAKVLGVISIKGGVGKTTISSSLAASLVNHFGKKVLLVDANYNAPNLGLHMDIVEPDKTIHHVLDGKAHMKSAIHTKFGVDVIPGSYICGKKLNYLKLRDKIKTLKDDYDFVVVDSSPTLNDEVLSTMLASDLLYLVSTPDYPTLSCSLRAAKLAKQRGRPIAGIILNKIRDPKFELSMDEIENTMEIPVVAKIPDDKNNTRALYTRIPTSVYHAKSPFSKEIVNLGRAISGTPEKRGLFKLLMPGNLKKEHVNRQLMKKNFYSKGFDKDE